MSSIDKVRVLVVGDSGVGKTTLVHLISQGQPIVGSPTWTVGCSVEVCLHEYREGTPGQKTYFVELWDIGGSSSHRNTRSVFYNPTHGIILVHDITNKKSQQNLHKWLAEILNKDSTSSCKSLNSGIDAYDPEQFVGSTQIPILVVGTKYDLVDRLRSNHNIRRASSIAEECGADEILLDCHQVRSLAAGTSSSVKLTRFLDKVIERRFQSRDKASPFIDRRTRMISSSNIKPLHND